MRNKIVILLDQKFVDAASADKFLRDEVGTVNINSLSDKETERLLEQLQRLQRVRAGSREERMVKNLRLPGKICPNCGKKFHKQAYQSVSEFLARIHCSAKYAYAARRTR